MTDDKNVNNPAADLNNSSKDSNNNVEDLKKYIAQAEENLELAKKSLFEITGEKYSKPSTKLPADLNVAADGKVIEGIFNGENMVGPEGKVFSVPANYASKSKLVEGDRLKLTIAEDGSFIFKQIAPVERKKLVGKLSFEDNAYFVFCDGKRYNLLHASVTFHKAQPGNSVTIVVPADGNSQWAAFENIIHDVAPNPVPEPSDFLDLEPKKQNESVADPFFTAPIPPAPAAGQAPIPAPPVAPQTPVQPPEVQPPEDQLPQVHPSPAPMGSVAPAVTAMDSVSPESGPKAESNSLGETTAPVENTQDLEI